MEGCHVNKNDKELQNLSDIIQVFTGSVSKPIPGYKGKYVVHASYTINLAAEWDEYSVPVNQFIKELEIAHELGAIGIVVHMGKKLDLSIEDAYNNMYTSLLYVHSQTKHIKDVQIFLETSTGQGSEICFKLEDFSYYIKKLIHNKNKEVANRFRICLDTCHVFAAGYDLRKEPQILMYLEAFEELIGLRYIGLIHINDSLNPIGSNVDRHQSIGDGYIGKEGLMFIKNYFHKLKVPIILETPDNKMLRDLKMIKDN
jgi:deoxyribonuclease-4